MLNEGKYRKGVFSKKFSKYGYGFDMREFCSKNFFKDINKDFELCNFYLRDWLLPNFSYPLTVKGVKGAPINVHLVLVSFSDTGVKIFPVRSELILNHQCYLYRYLIL